MKTVIYYNVTTGEAFDQEGTLRTQNNPFSASYGEQRTFEWHLMADTDSAKPVSEWLPWTEWDITPQSAFSAADDNFLAAYPATLKESASAGAGAISVTANSAPQDIAPSGMLRIFRRDHSVLMLPYTAFNTTSDGMVFAVEIPEDEEFPEGTRLDIMEEPLVKTLEISAERSQPEQGIFSFDMQMNSWRLSEKMEYSDIDSLTAKGLELCVSGEQTVLLRCRVPFLIKNVISIYSV